MKKLSVLFAIFLLCGLCRVQQTTKTSDKYKNPTDDHSVIELNDDNFDELVKNGEEEGWLLFFYAPWCRHCKKLAPTFKGVSNLMQRNVGGAIDW